MYFSVSKPELIPGETVSLTCTSDNARLILIVESGKLTKAIAYIFKNNIYHNCWVHTCALLPNTSSRYKIVHCEDIFPYQLSVSITNVTVNDTGNYSCGVQGNDVTNWLYAASPVNIRVLGVFLFSSFAFLRVQNMVTKIINQ